MSAPPLKADMATAAQKMSARNDENQYNGLVLIVGAIGAGLCSDFGFCSRGMCVSGDRLSAASGWAITHMRTVSGVDASGSDSRTTAAT